MEIASLLSPALTLCRYESSSKKRIIEDIAKHIGKQFPNLDTNLIFSSLIAREKLGSTGIGGGIAIPHCRIPESKSTIGMLISLEKSIDFNAIDNQEVDIIFVLLVPEDADDNHLKTLANIAEIFSKKDVLQNIRDAQSTEALLDAIKNA